MSKWPLSVAMSSGVVRSPGLRRFDVGPGLDQRPGRGGGALPRGEVQRRQAALACRSARCSGTAGSRRRRRRARPSRRGRGRRCGAVGALRLVGRPSPSPARARPGRRPSRSRSTVGAARHQQPHHLGPVGGRGEHQRRLAVRRLHRVDVGRARRATPSPSRPGRSCAASISAVAPVLVAAVASAPAGHAAPRPPRPRRLWLATWSGV